MRHLGFTGSRHRVTLTQEQALAKLLKRLREKERNFLWMHNGDCITADNIAASLWEQLGGKVCLHPPSNDIYRAFFNKAQLVCMPKGYIARDHDIVESSELLIATPQSYQEEIRSGTWATIRHAKIIRRRVKIIYPDGEIKTIAP